jgi:subtilisin family serine protease
MASGTSMSAPQVAGLAAVYWSLEPTINNLELKNKLELDASKDLVYNTALDNEYDNLRTLLSTPNRILYNKYSSNTPGSFNSIGNANFE